MKKVLSLLTVMVVVTVASFAQSNPVSWNYSAKKIADKTYEIHLSATIASPWHTYSQSSPEGGPIPTKIEFTKNPLITLDGKTKEVGKLETHHDDNFGIDVKQYSGKVDFVQIVKLKSNAKTNVSGTIEYMACDESQCLPPATVNFSVAVGGK